MNQVNKTENGPAPALRCEAMVRHEYRLVWKRVGQKQKERIYKNVKGAERRAVLFGPEPWRYLRKDPDDRVCCGGDMCGCGGLTYRQQNEAQRRDMPAIEYVRIEQRQIGPWLDLPNKGISHPAVQE